MKPLRQVNIYILLTLTIALCQEDSDEGRPYEFGFTIDGQQHRHEKKDQNGIVQGEFGFITADGVYHVTVYATDENGNFKILSMRNIRISAPLDGSPATGPISPEAGKYLGNKQQPEQPKSTSNIEPPQQQPIVQTPGPQAPPRVTTQKLAPYVFTTQPTVKPACGGCGYITTQKSASGQQFQFQNPAFKESSVGIESQSASPVIQNEPLLNVAQNQLPIDSSIPSGVQQNVNQNSGAAPQYPETQPFQNPSLKEPSVATRFQSSNNKFNEPPAVQNEPLVNGPQNQNSGVLPQDPEQPSISNFGPQNNVQGPYQSTQGITYPVSTELLPPGINIPNQNQENVYPNQQSTIQNDNTPYQGSQPVDISIPSNIGSIPGFPRQEPVSKLPPISVSDNTIHVEGSKPIDIPIKDKYPGMIDGLPDGVEETDIKNILYKFHYTVGFHGHYEKGLKNGAKIGGYFVNGRDGISRVVTYIADENGYRPKFKFINLGLDSPDTPKEGTEKQFGLKSFEFVWYPIE